MGKTLPLKLSLHIKNVAAHLAAGALGSCPLSPADDAGGEDEEAATSVVDAGKKSYCCCCCLCDDAGGLRMPTESTVTDGLRRLSR